MFYKLSVHLSFTTILEFTRLDRIFIAAGNKSFFHFYFQDFYLGSYIKLFHFHNF